MWLGLRKKLSVQVPANRCVIRTSIRECRQFEQRTDFSLPASYLTYIQEIGGGTARHYFQIYCPNPLPKEISLEHRIREIRGSKLLAEIYGEPELIERMIPFGDTITGDIFVWDPAQRHGRKRLEYAILVLPRDSRRTVVLTDSFSDFVKNYVFGRKFEEVVCGGVDPESTLTFDYKPFTTRKMKPKN